ncbi:MAG: hypothetical protein C0405_08490 [Desulfovibrio sp.]|nr:hypothetical protein [Desulfovibrio sp.]
MEMAWNILAESWRMLAESSVYVLFGLVMGGLLKVFLSPEYVGRHLGRGRFVSVFKAALLGVPLPLCSCGVLPAAAALKKQGANNGAVTSFLISTPESGVDSIAVTYALLDPVMTLARPLAAFASASVAGLAQNLLENPQEAEATGQGLALACLVDGCNLDGQGQAQGPPPSHSLGEKLKAGLGFALGELWGDMAAWFGLGLLLTGAVTVLLPEDFLGRYLGGGLGSMLIMLAVGIPIYICASASTPIAAALILKGVSPGAALVFLLAGPATNLTSLTVLWNMMGRKATVIYLAGLSLSALLCGLALDQVYAWAGWEPKALLGQAGELLPEWAQVAGACVLILLSLPLLWRGLRSRLFSPDPRPDACASPAKVGST